MKAKALQEAQDIRDQIEAEEHLKKTNKVNIAPDKIEEYSLNKLFLQFDDKNKFYQGGKQTHINPKDAEDQEKIAMKEYFEFCQANRIVIQPHFVSFDYNTLYISQIYVDATHGQAIG